MRSQAASASLVQRALGACRRSGILPVVAASIVALAVAGCANGNSGYQSSGVTRHAAVQPPMPRPKVEIEDDGKPVQSPPARTMRPDEDDPTQPWSPNYGRAGGSGGQRHAEALTAPPRLPTTTRLPRPDVHPAAARRMSEDEIVARAVAQQEMAAQRR